MNKKDAINKALYDPELYEGLPVSPQVVAKRCDDGFLLAAQRRIEKPIRYDRRSMRIHQIRTKL
ncbi:hypothetical protein HYDPIDRAFT_110182, partial [Hydnomerulius pinastri MD-312]